MPDNIFISIMRETSNPAMYAAPVPLHPYQDPPNPHHGLRMEKNRLRTTKLG